MSSSNNDSMSHSWDAVLQELIDKGEVSEDVLHDSDTIMRWWKSLDSTKQNEIIGRVRNISQGREVGTTGTEKQGHRIDSKMTQWYRKPRYIVLGIAIVIFCFMPILNMPYEVVAQKQVEEEYVTLEPYTVLEEVREPYQSYYDHVVWEEHTEPAIPGTSFGELSILRPRIEQRPITKYRTVTKEVTEYREVTKTRLVTRPVIETETKRVSILRYLLR